MLIRNERFRVTFDRLEPAAMVKFYDQKFEARFPGFPPFSDRGMLLGAYTGLFKTQATLQFTKTTIVRLAPRRYRTHNKFLVTEFRKSGTSTRTGTITLTWQFRRATPFIVLDETVANH